MNNTAAYEYAKCSCSVHNLASSSGVFCVVVPGAMASLLTVDDVLRGVLGEDGDSDGDFDGYTSGGMTVKRMAEATKTQVTAAMEATQEGTAMAAAVSPNTYIRGGVPLT